MLSWLCLGKLLLAFPTCIQPSRFTRTRHWVSASPVGVQRGSPHRSQVGSPGREKAQPSVISGFLHCGSCSFSLAESQTHVPLRPLPPTAFALQAAKHGGKKPTLGSDLGMWSVHQHFFSTFCIRHGVTRAQCLNLSEPRFTNRNPGITLATPSDGRVDLPRFVRRQHSLLPSSMPEAFVQRQKERPREDQHRSPEKLRLGENRWLAQGNASWWPWSPWMARLPSAPQVVWNPLNPAAQTRPSVGLDGQLYFFPCREIQRELVSGGRWWSGGGACCSLGDLGRGWVSAPSQGTTVFMQPVLDPRRR